MNVVFSQNKKYGGEKGEAVFEIKVLICALAGCIDQKNGAPGHLFLCYSHL